MTSSIPLVSVVVPVYNAEKYLPRCLDSLLAQTERNIEILAVNDGSSDGGLDVLRAYEKKDKRLRVFDGPNQGASCARNIGLKAARGRYLMFCDADDWVDENWLELFAAHLHDDGVQMVVQGAVSTALRWHYSPWRPSLRFTFAPLRHMFPFSVKLLGTGIFNVINDNIFTLILGLRYSKSQAGFYSQGRKWSFMVYSGLWGMMANVSQSVLAQVADTPDRQQQVFRKLASFMSYVTCPCMLGLAFVAPELTTITVTDKWAASVPYMQLFCLWGIIAPLNNLCTNTLVSRGRSGVYMAGTIALDVVQLAVIYLSASLGIYQMVINYVAVCFLWFFLWLACIRREMPIPIGRLLLRDILPYALLALVCIGLAEPATAPICNVYLRFTAKIALVAALYIGALLAFRSALLRETLEYLKRIAKKK